MLLSCIHSSTHHITSHHMFKAIQFECNYLCTASQHETAMPFPNPYGPQNFTIFSIRCVSISIFSIFFVTFFVVRSQYSGPMLDTLIHEIAYTMSTLIQTHRYAIAVDHLRFSYLLLMKCVRQPHWF